jgi:uncharacterized protein
MTPKKALKLLEKFRVPKHIIGHIKKVTYVAGLICDSYIKKGIKVDKNAVICGALLHDLIRIIDIKGAGYTELCNHSSKKDIILWEKLKNKYKDIDHSIAAYKYLLSIGERKIALIVRKHKFDAVVDPKFKPKNIEEKITTYADKRVLHTEIVSLKKRFKDGEKRYNPKKENLNIQAKIHQKYFEMETEIFCKIDLRPSQIK